MVAAATMLFRYVEGVFVGAHTSAKPDPVAWTAHCKTLERHRAEVLGVIVFTAGGAPSAAQREELREAFHGGATPRTAIMTGSALVRGVITSLNWFSTQPLAAFALHDLAGALDHAAGHATPAQRAQITAELSAIANTLSLVLPSLTVARGAERGR